MNSWRWILASAKVWFTLKQRFQTKSNIVNMGVSKIWYPQIIHFNRVFHYKPSILGGGSPIFGSTPTCGNWKKNPHSLVSSCFVNVSTHRIPNAQSVDIVFVAIVFRVFDMTSVPDFKFGWIVPKAYWLDFFSSLVRESWCVRKRQKTMVKNPRFFRFTHEMLAGLKYPKILCNYIFL